MIDIAVWQAATEYRRFLLHQRSTLRRQYPKWQSSGHSSAVGGEETIQADNHSTASFPAQPGSASTRKVINQTLMKQEMMGWQWQQLDHVQIIRTLLQTDNHASTSAVIFLPAGCYSWRPTNSVKAVKQKKQ